MTADWVSAGANVVLALSVVLGAFLAVSRWPVAFTVSKTNGPLFGEAVIEGEPQPKSTTWVCEIVLARGDVAHISSIQLERRILGIWTRVDNGCMARERLPASLTNGERLSVHFSADRGDKSEFRIVIREYGTLRRLMVPFLEPQRVSD